MMDGNAYSGFAKVYDMFMDDVPYEEWSGYLIELLRSYGITDGIVLDLGCGTGKMTRLLAKAGYDMIGVDCSEEMLGIAKEREEDDSKILYLAQDMRQLELYGTVRAVVSVCDAMNYITEEEDLLDVFRLVHNYLDPGGVLIFDMNTLYKYREILGNAVFCENREEGSFIWENYYEEEEGINEYDMTFFIREADGRYQKFQETHIQRGYPVETIQRLLLDAGMKWEACYEAFSKEPPGRECERVCIIARECAKQE